jgi:hypothetical protein
MSSEFEAAPQPVAGVFFPNGEPPGFKEAVARVREFGDAEQWADMKAAIQVVNAMIAASHGKCRQKLPDADIEMIADGSGQRFYRCHHTPPHRWPA